MLIGVTGATGGVGSRVLRALGDRAVGLARRPGDGDRRADYDDPGSLREAFAGLDTLVFISSDGVAETMRRHHENVVAAAVAARVRHIVYTSIIDIDPASRFYYAAVHRDTETQLAASGIDHCLVRTSIFSDFFVSTWIEPAVGAGSLGLPAGDGRMSLVTRDDTARTVAAAAARRLEGAVDATGPAALTAAEVCEIAGLRYEPLSEDEYRARLARDGEPAWLIEAFTSMFRSVREGRFEHVSPALTGEPAQSFAAFIRDAR